jgi:molybdopterin-guanine dinucleotide biosynthesis protein A
VSTGIAGQRTVTIARPLVVLGILAGGQARRLGGADKALALHHGEALAERTLRALGGGFAQILLSYNGASAQALPAAATPVPDLRPGFPGPLGGVEALLAAARGEWLLTVPVDLAHVPADLAERLLACALPGRGVSARDADGAQPLVALWPVASSRNAIGAALDAGERAVHRVQEILGFAPCELAPLRLGNLNTPADFEPRR